MTKKPTRVCLSITTYRGWTARAIHYYGELREYDADDPERNGVWFEMTAADAKEANKRDNLTTIGAWEAGDHGYAFKCRKALLKAAVVCARETYGKDVEVYIGHIAGLLEDMEKLTP